jgi:hypothetical protein
MNCSIRPLVTGRSRAWTTPFELRAGGFRSARTGEVCGVGANVGGSGWSIGVRVGCEVERGVDGDRVRAAAEDELKRLALVELDSLALVAEPDS